MTFFKPILRIVLKSRDAVEWSFDVATFPALS